jgi:putative ABC transport system substrate-binding protein
MKRRLFIASALASAMVPRHLAAQQAVIRPARIGWLTAQRPASLAPYLDALRDGLAGYGRVEGRNLEIEYRYADDAIDRVPDLAAELMRQKVSLIVAQGAAVPILSRLNLPVPVVYVVSADPVSAGLAESLARPRGNMTGLTFMAAEINAKRIEFLHELIPGLKRVALLGHPEHPGEQFEREATEEAGARFGVAISYYPTRTKNDLDAALAAIDANRPQAISIFSDGFAVQHRQTMIDFATSRRIPAAAGWAVFAESGALCSYGPRLSESYRRLAYYIDRILKGARAADLPIERPTHFELVINLRTAKALNLAIPAALAERADRLIE